MQKIEIIFKNGETARDMSIQVRDALRAAGFQDVEIRKYIGVGPDWVCTIDCNPPKS